ncbi:hypothetical protein [Paraburkholderia sediminicola]|uniref:hypothetical protein n=1 Tax=Paraburkholderia sediminicola TaxID=458836 RepID=UPI0038BBD263
MNAITERGPELVAPDEQTLVALRDLDALMLAQPQVEIRLDHLLHAGLYARTCHLPADVLASGAVLRRATVLVISGDVTIFTGNDSARLKGFHVLPGLRGRKALFRTHAETQMTMVLPSDAQSVSEAELEITDEPQSLAKLPGNITITGQKS